MLQINLLDFIAAARSGAKYQSYHISTIYACAFCKLHVPILYTCALSPMHLFLVSAMCT